jgi:hypothetical protein
MLTKTLLSFKWLWNVLQNIFTYTYVLNNFIIRKNGILFYQKDQQSHELRIKSVNQQMQNMKFMFCIY